MNKKCYLLIFALLFLIVTNSLAVEILAWGPNKYERTSGEPNVYSTVIPLEPGLAKLVVKNGKLDGDNRIEDSLSSARVYVNGNLYFGPNDFNKKVYLLEAPINLLGNDELSINLASSPGSYLNVEILVDFPLPPDPGDAGKETLLGIDSDNDGVRDDIQRYIYITYPREKKVRLALMQIARNYQELLPDAADPEKAYENVLKLNRSRLCLYYVKGGTIKASPVQDVLFAEILNTRERSLRYLEFSNSLAGKSTVVPPVNKRKDCCLFFTDEPGGE